MLISQRGTESSNPPPSSGESGSQRELACRGREARLFARVCVQRRRDSRSALRLMRKMLKKQGFVPKLLVTDKLRSYAHLIETTARLLAPPPRHRTRPRETDNGSSAIAIVGPRPLIRLGSGGDPREVPPNGRYGDQMATASPVTKIVRSDKANARAPACGKVS